MSGYGDNRHGIPANFTTRQVQPSLYGPNAQMPILANTASLPAPPPPRPPVPVLAGRGGPTPDVGILAQAGGTAAATPQNTGGILSKAAPARRDQTALSTPNLRIGMNEALMRIGGAGARAAQNGGLESFGAMTDAYGQIQDANRSTALAEYQAAMEAEAAKAEAAANAPKPEDNSERIGQIDQTLYDMERAKAALQEGGVTGFIDTYLFGLWDKATGNEDQNTRKLLAKLQVDDTLLRIAQTKGAISNKEMDLFLSPAPTMSDQESVWIRWIEDRQQALGRIRERLATGTTVSNVASADQVSRFGSNMNEITLTDEQQALVDKNK